jgi:hypothetical protein
VDDCAMAGDKGVAWTLRRRDGNDYRKFWDPKRWRRDICSRLAWISRGGRGTNREGSRLSAPSCFDSLEASPFAAS